MTRKMIWTIGYEGAKPQDFVATLVAAGVSLVVDVRAVAWSRIPAYGKTRLGAMLADAGIGYCHLVSLGDPKEGREAARAGEMETFRKIFAAHLESPAARQGLVELAALAHNHTVCLLCYERHPEQCHRLMVANRLDAAFSVKHIGVQNSLSMKAARHVPEQGKSAYPGQGAAPGQ